MQQIEQDEQPEYQEGFPEDEIETVHVYMVREEKTARPARRWGKWEPRRIANITAQLIAVLLLSGLNIAPPAHMIQPTSQSRRTSYQFSTSRPARPSLLLA